MVFAPPVTDQLKEVAFRDRTVGTKLTGAQVFGRTIDGLTVVGLETRNVSVIIYVVNLKRKSKFLFLGAARTQRIQTLHELQE